MRWIVFIPVVLIFAGLDAGVGGMFSITWLGGAAPSLVAMLVAFIALHASPRSSMWAAWWAGLLIDTAPGSGGSGAAAVVLGPHALGMVAAAWIVLLCRGMLFRSRLPTLVAVSGVVAAASALALTSIHTLRFWLPWTQAAVPQRSVDVLLRLCGDAVATSLLALLVGWVLLMTVRAWRFDTSPGRLDYAGRRGG
jgi:cell shape-determining protein MreD